MQKMTPDAAKAAVQRTKTGDNKWKERSENKVRVLSLSLFLLLAGVQVPRELTKETILVSKIALDRG